MQPATPISRSTRIDVVWGSETAFLGKILDAHRFDIITIFVSPDLSDAR